MVTEVKPAALVTDGRVAVPGPSEGKVPTVKNRGRAKNGNSVKKEKKAQEGNGALSTEKGASPWSALRQLSPNGCQCSLSRGSATWRVLPAIPRTSPSPSASLPRR